MSPRNRNKPLILREETGVYGGAIVLYRADDGSAALDVRLDKDTIWRSQKHMAELFATDRSVITKHLRNIFQTGELDKKTVSAVFAHTAADGKTYQVQYYNLDVIISVGYRVNSKRGTHACDSSCEAHAFGGSLASATAARRHADAAARVSPKICYGQWPLCVGCNRTEP